MFLQEFVSCFISNLDKDINVEDVCLELENANRKPYFINFEYENLFDAQKILSDYANGDVIINLLKKFIIDIIQSTDDIFSLNQTIILNFYIFSNKKYNIIIKKAFDKLINNLFYTMLDDDISMNQKINILFNLKNILIEKYQVTEQIFFDTIIKINYQFNIIQFINSLKVKYFIKYFDDENDGDGNNKKIFDSRHINSIFKQSSHFNLYNEIFGNNKYNIPFLINNIFNDKIMRMHTNEDFSKFKMKLVSFFLNLDDEFKIDIKKLERQGKEWINKQLRKRIRDEDKLKIIEENLIYLNKYSQNIIEKNILCFLISVFYGFSHDKKINNINNIFEINEIKEYIESSNSITNNSILKVRNDDAQILSYIFGDNEFNLNDFIDPNVKQIEWNKIDEYLNNDIQNWFIEYAKEFMENLKIKNINKIKINDFSYNSKKMIITMYENQNAIIAENKNNVLFNLFYYYDYNNFSYYNNFINEDKEFMIKNNYDKNKAINDLNTIINSKLQINGLKENDERILIDNTLLSIKDRYELSKFEFKGDIIYRIAINDLILNAKIKKLNNLDFFSKTFQEKIASSLELEKYIQKSNYFVINKKNNTSIADYFEMLIYFIYKYGGIELVKEKILILIIKEYPSIFFNQDELSWIDDEDKFYKDRWEYYGDNIFTLPPRYYHWLRYIDVININDNLELFSFNQNYVDACCKIIKNILWDCIKLKLIDDIEQKNEENKINNIKRNLDESLNHEMDNKISWMLKKFSANKQSFYFEKIFYLYKYKKDKFDDFISKIVSEKFN